MAEERLPLYWPTAQATRRPSAYSSVAPEREELAELVPCPDLVSRMVSCRAAAYMARKGTPDKTAPPSPPRRAEAVCGVPWPRAGCYARGCFWLGPEGDFGAGRRTVLTSFVWLTEAVLHCVKWRSVVPRPKAGIRWLVLRLVPADFKQSCHGRLVVTGWRRLILRRGLIDRRWLVVIRWRAIITRRVITRSHSCPRYAVPPIEVPPPPAPIRRTSGR